MNLYLIEADTSGYDVFSRAVVVADSILTAQETHPCGYVIWDREHKMWRLPDSPDLSFDPDDKRDPGDWVTPDRVTVTYLGKPCDPQPRVVCASFHAG